MTVQQRMAIIALNDLGLAPKRIAETVGLHIEAVLRLVDPQWAERRKQKINEARQLKREGFTPTVNGRYVRSVNRPAKEELLAALRSIPDDARDLTARFFGDPLPGRSALDMKVKAQQSKSG